jgi:hypothetical protein
MDLTRAARVKLAWNRANAGAHQAGSETSISMFTFFKQKNMNKWRIFLIAQESISDGP